MRALRIGTLALLAALMSTTGCEELLGHCHGDALRMVLTVPDSVTLHIGGSAVVTAGERYGICESPPRRDYDWSISAPDIVSVTSVDAIHARLTGVRPGQATITPKYRSSGVSLTTVTVTVVP